jgi:hypothetical protein
LIAITFLSPFYHPLAVSLLRCSRYTGSMNAMPPPSHSGFDRPATYRIGVQGHVPDRWRDRLEGMAITEDSPAAESTVTTLLGELADQAALAGVLNTLIELHLSVVSVERLSTA